MAPASAATARPRTSDGPLSAVPAGRSYSVIVCTYNRREYADDCVQSVLGQTRPPEQVVVVDDGSSDGTAAYLRQRFPEIVVLEQQNRGRSVALNRALAVSEGDWVCFLDDDDLWHRDKLAEVDSYLEANPDCFALNHPVWFFADDEDRHDTGYGFRVDFAAANLDECHAAVEHGDPSTNDPSYLAIRGNSHRLLLARNRGAYSASVVHRQTVILAGAMAPMLACADDWLMFLNISRVTEWHTLPRRLGFARVHGGRSTGSAENAAAIMAAFIAVWYGGRTFPEARSGAETRRAMADYQEDYRWLIQRFLWDSVKAGRWRDAREMRRLARPLIRGWRNWLYIHIPPPVTYWADAVLGVTLRA
jgi:glycosyltransferase involved in cell wall biosynthesis